MFKLETANADDPVGFLINALARRFASGAVLGFILALLIVAILVLLLMALGYVKPEPAQNTLVPASAFKSGPVPPASGISEAYFHEAPAGDKDAAKADAEPPAPSQPLHSAPYRESNLEKSLRDTDAEQIGKPAPSRPTGPTGIPTGPIGTPEHNPKR